MKSETVNWGLLVALVLCVGINVGHRIQLTRQHETLDRLSLQQLQLCEQLGELTNRLEQLKGKAAALATNNLQRARSDAPAPYLTVEVGGGLGLKFTNCVDVVPNHEPGCHLIKYLGPNGTTNEFHAWAVPIHVSTNP